MSNPPSPSNPAAGFLFCACQGGAEAALKARMAEVLPASKPAAWRRGIVSFKLPPADGLSPAPELPANLLERLVFARTVAHSLGQVAGADPAALTTAVIELAGGTGFADVHVWPRQFEPGPRGAEDVAAAALARQMVLAACGLGGDLDPAARAGDRVLDVVLDTVDRWWVGWHTASEPATRWPGGIYPPATGPLPETVVSRAWLKLGEAVATFGIEWGLGARVVELGCAPGGACQRLLEAGLDVVGVDPALVDPALAAQPRFTQWRMRAREVPLKKFQRCDWLLTDMNIDPASTMAALARVLTEGTARPRGIIATLKLPEWSRSAEIDGWLDAFRSWGYEPKARQLSTAGREICIAARPVGRGTATPRRRATRRRVE